MTGATPVKDYFLRHGIAQHRISTQALGEHQPAYPNDSEDGRKLNRRVVIHLK